MSVYAVIDVGTNSTRLLVADRDENSFKELKRITTITRLGEGLKSSGKISAEAAGRTVEVIKRYISEARELDANSLHIFATQALREAQNAEEIAAYIERETGLKLLVISGEEEAEFTFKGVTSDFSSKPVCVVDIGGGSTEVAVGFKKVEFSQSIPLGCVKLEEQYRLRNAINPEQLEEILKRLEDYFSSELKCEKLPAFEELVFVGGTATTIAAISLGLKSYDRNLVHGAVVKIEALKKITEELSLRNAEERLKIFPVIEEERAYVISAGALLLQSILSVLKREEFRVSEKDILDGFLISISE